VAQLDAILDADDAARRFQERFEGITAELRDSLSTERQLLDVARHLCEAAMAKAKGLEVALGHSLADGSDLDELRAQLVDAERQAEEARLREANAREQAARSAEDAAALRVHLRLATEQAAKLRNTVNSELADRRISRSGGGGGSAVQLAKTGTGASPFADWKAAVSGQRQPPPPSVSDSGGRSVLSPGQLRALGHLPPGEREGIHAALEQRALIMKATGGAAAGSSSAPAAASSPSQGALRGSALTRAGSASIMSSSPPRLMRASHGGAAEGPVEASAALHLATAPPAAAAPTEPGFDGGEVEGDGSRLQRRLLHLDIDPHPFFPAHLYLAPAPSAHPHAADQHQLSGGAGQLQPDLPLGVDLRMGPARGVGGGEASAMAPPGSSEAATPPAFEDARDGVRRVLARIESRAAKVLQLQAMAASAAPE